MKPPQEATTEPSPQRTVPTCKCGYELVRNELLLREAAGSFKPIAVFRFCIKCRYTSRWIKSLGQDAIDPTFWERLRRLQNFVVERAPDGSLRPWINEMMRKSELGKRLLQKHGLYSEELDLQSYAPGADTEEANIEEVPF